MIIALLQWRSMRTARVFRPRVDQKGVEGAGHRADGVLQKRKLLGQRLGARNAHAADDVRVTVEVFGRRMDDEIEPSFEWPLHPRQGERVVSNRQRCHALAPDRRHGFEVDQLEQRVRGRFDPDHAGAGLAAPERAHQRRWNGC